VRNDGVGGWGSADLEPGRPHDERMVRLKTVDDLETMNLVVIGNAIRLLIRNWEILRRLRGMA
jgi:hypothetical protein